VVTEVSNLTGRHQRGRASPEMMLENSFKVNFWDIIFPKEDKLEVTCAFDENEKMRLVDCMVL